jgi:hypothetical protein
MIFRWKSPALRPTLVGVLWGVVTILTWSCMTASSDPSMYGVQAGHEGFVPARIAILPCHLWPASSPFATYVAPTVPPPTLEAICDRFDREILAGFERQPYMKGYTPRFVKKSLEAAGLGDHLSKLPNLWNPPAPGCTKAPSATACYRSQIASLPTWGLWLGQLSEATRNADALIIPTITNIKEERVSDRGLQVAARSVTVELLLVDANRGQLLWTGGGIGRQAKKRLAGQGPLEGLPYPDWEEILSLVFTANLWRDFPGRQVL